MSYTLDEIERALRVVLSTKTHPEMVNAIVEDTRAQLAPRAKRVEAGGRREGRTLRMVRELPAGTRYIVVHTAEMKTYLERMLRDVRPDLQPDQHNRPFILVVQSTRDLDRLRGCAFEVDHAVWEDEGMSQEARDLLRALYRPRRAR